MRIYAFALLALAACSAPVDTTPTWVRDVQPIVQSHCQQCHHEGGIGPFALMTSDDLRTHEALVRAQVSNGIMPPWPADDACADYTPNGALSDADKATLFAWFDAGAPEGRGTAASPPAAGTGLSRVDLTTSMAEPFTPTQGPDQYRCFLLDWPATVPEYITGFALRPGAPQLVHHANIFFVKPDSVAAYEAKDAADPGPGYECYSFPNQFNGEGGWIGTFVPGSLGADFPDGTGVKLMPGSKVLIQVHYNIVNGSAPDQSAVDLKLADHVRREGVVEAWADPNWTNGDMPVPAFQSDVVHSFSEDPTLFLSLASPTFTDGQPVKLFMAMIHMHALGSRASVYIQRKDGTRECVLDIPRWQFHWQLPYALATPKVVNPGDKLTVECHWDNSAEHQPVPGTTPRNVNWGPNTADEMCVAGVYLSQ